MAPFAPHRPGITVAGVRLLALLVRRSAAAPSRTAQHRHQVDVAALDCGPGDPHPDRARPRHRSSRGPSDRTSLRPPCRSANSHESLTKASAQKLRKSGEVLLRASGYRNYVSLGIRETTEADQHTIVVLFVPTRRLFSRPRALPHHGLHVALVVLLTSSLTSIRDATATRRGPCPGALHAIFIFRKPRGNGAMQPVFLTGPGRSSMQRERR